MDSSDDEGEVYPRVTFIRQLNFLDDDEMVDESDVDYGDENRFDSLCALCDDGGKLISCQGRCNRSFHPTVLDGFPSTCPSLGYTAAELQFYCVNCKLTQHQCFVCGELGSSNESSGAQVFRCVIGRCGHFYHPHCVAEFLHNGNEAEVLDIEKEIAAGEEFECPLHRCHVCKELEEGWNWDHDLQMAVCRRCPRAYHRKCLPRGIAFEYGEAQNFPTRDWESLIPDRIMIYCLEHDIDNNLGTPLRDHIKFLD